MDGQAGVAEDGQRGKLIGGSDSRKGGSDPMVQYKYGEKPWDNLLAEVYSSLLSLTVGWKRLTCLPRLSSAYNTSRTR